MNDVTHILSAIEHGDPRAAEQPLPLVYDELRKLAAQRPAQEKPGQTLQATALVHEAYLRLVGPQDLGWNSRGHFFAAAAEAMRRILIDRARDKGRLECGDGRRQHYLNLDELFNDKAPPDDLIALDHAPTRLADVDHDAAALVKLLIFAGSSPGQAAEAREIARRTADRDWAFALAWLFEQLGTADEEREGRARPRAAVLLGQNDKLGRPPEHS